MQEKKIKNEEVIDEIIIDEGAEIIKEEASETVEKPKSKKKKAEKKEAPAKNAGIVRKVSQAYCVVELNGEKITISNDKNYKTGDIVEL